MAFYVGQKVCFVGDKKAPLSFYRDACESHGGVMPVYGEVYTVRSIFTLGASKGESLLRLTEIDNSGLAPFTVGQIEPGYPARCFRPVVESKTDISLFKAMLNPSDKRVDA